MADCIFCKIVNNQMNTDKIYEDDLVIVFKDIRPKAPVHLLIVSKEHIKNLFEVKESQAALMSHMMMLAPKLAKEKGLANGFRMVINTGKGGGQEIDHLHFHLLGNGHLPGF